VAAAALESINNRRKLRKAPISENMHGSISEKHQRQRKRSETGNGVSRQLNAAYKISVM